MKISDFPRASEQDYLTLRRYIDELPPERSHLVENCELPPGCDRTHTTIGFYKVSHRYCVYFAESVLYTGRNRAMVEIGGGTPKSFQSFNEMKRFLKTLPSEAARPEPARMGSEGYGINEAVYKEELAPPGQAASTPVTFARGPERSTRTLSTAAVVTRVMFFAARTIWVRTRPKCTG